MKCAFENEKLSFVVLQHFLLTLKRGVTLNDKYNCLSRKVLIYIYRYDLDHGYLTQVEDAINKKHNLFCKLVSMFKKVFRLISCL